jgi:hypothetical protein
MIYIIAILLVLISIESIRFYIKEVAPNKLTTEEITFRKNCFIVHNKENFSKQTIQKAQQNIDIYLKQKNSIASTTES